MHFQLNSAWRRMIVVNVAVVAALFAYKITVNIPGEQYTQLLADYHFGLTKRALIGAIVGLGFPTLPLYAPYVIGTVVWLATAGLFLMLFRKTFGFSEANLPLLIFTAGSPFFLKNFVQTLGYYDIYGCLLAIALLLVPARSVLYVLAAASGAMILILIHHLHALLYIPTVAAIVVIRHHLTRQLSATDFLLASALALCISVLFLDVQFRRAPGVPIDQFAQHLHARMTDPSLGNISAGIFYRTFSDEIRDTWALMPKNLLRAPIYAALIALHAPLLRYFADIVHTRTERRHRQAVIAAIGMVSLGYLVIFATVYDYARWISDWATCMILLLIAAKELPSSIEPAPINGHTGAVRWLGWGVTMIPRIGVTKPF